MDLENPASKKEKQTNTEVAKRSLKYWCERFFKPSPKRNLNDENVERGNWTGRLDFIISCIGFAVGLGNIWRFPYLCYRNGGGAFLIPYVLSLSIMGIPMFMIETGIGQFTSQGPLTCWDFMPALRGIGYGMMVVSALIAVYYNTIVSWAIYYLFASFRSELPWTNCGPWSSPLCENRLKPVTYESCMSEASLRPEANGTCYNRTSNTLYGIYNETIALKYEIKPHTPADEYLNYVGLQAKYCTSLRSFGQLRWDMSLCLMLAWLLIFLCLFRGIKSSGKVVYVTALLPYAVLIILFVMGLMQDGSAQGIRFYIFPKYERLKDAKVWKDAAAQIFFSLGNSWGGMIVFASFNRFHTNMLRDTIIICLSNCLTSVFAGFVIFSFLGAFAKNNGVKVEDVADQGVGLAFVIYPQACTQLFVPPLWAIIFFLMLVALGLDTQFALVETVVTCVTDTVKSLLPYKRAVLFVVCVVFFTMSLITTTPCGPYVVQLMDDYSCGWNVLMVATLECVAVSIYGCKRFSKDIEVMLGESVNRCLYWRIVRWWFIICWSALTPAMLMSILIFSLATYSGSTYGNYVFPLWANGIGWILTMAVLCPPIVIFFFTIATSPGANLKEKWKLSITPTKYWGPYLVQHRRLISYVEGFVVDPRGEENEGDGTVDQNSMLEKDLVTKGIK